MRIRAGILTKMQLSFVNNFNGCAIEAAKAAGYKNPKESARQLMKNPAIMEAIRMKQNAFIEESGKRLGSEINCSRSAIINRMWDLAQLSPKDTKETIGGQMFLSRHTDDADIIAHHSLMLFAHYHRQPSRYLQVQLRIGDIITSPLPYYPPPSRARGRVTRNLNRG